FSLSWAVVGGGFAWGQVQSGEASFTADQIQAGSSFPLTGEWLYRPGYLGGPDEKPYLSDSVTGFVAVPVPQLLNRVHWWLEDSDDFQKQEDTRLKKLGFDTERAEDGWYRLALNLAELPLGRRLFMEFEGVAMKSRAFCNGNLLGEHTGMFSRFD